ncbi:MAG: ATP synthase F1 subunit delta [Deltaproteobacteria bacterium]|nr:ATP synthase F1 subunit delta [Deltaproteobacteria bacterium]MCL4874042.1 ATP synthase F1 subunit delta [bacterium]
MKSSASKRFAKALIEVGRENNSWDQYGKELRSVLAIFSGNPDLEKTLLNPMYKLEDRLSLMDNVAASAGLSPHVAKFLGILVRTRNLRFLDEITAAYSAYEDGLAGRIRASVDSPTELPPALVEEIRKKLSSLTGKDVVLTCNHNPLLLGGLVLKIGNTILDGSLKTQLELMKEKILEGVV